MTWHLAMSKNLIKPVENGGFQGAKTPKIEMENEANEGIRVPFSKKTL